MWKIHQKNKRGKRNEAMQLQCQDQTAGAAYEEYTAVALADGSGKDDYAAKGAKAVVEIVSKLMARHFEELYQMDIKGIKFNVVITMKKELYQLCKQYQISLQQLQSTLAAAVIDEKTGRYILCHLGDGMIGGIVGQKQYILSYPENGVNNRYTKTTISDEIMDAVRVQKGENKELTKICLMSDGWTETADQPEQMVTLCMTRNDEILDNMEMNDDISFVIMSAT